MIAQIPMKDDRKAGYRFLSKINSSTYHPGEDLNSGSYGSADRNMPIYAMADGLVVYSRDAGAGWGKIIVIWHEKLGVWSRYAHFLSVSANVGERVKMGQIIGRCGKSGTASYHLHWEVLKKELPQWTNYPNGWSKTKVLEYWESPYEYVKKVNEEYGSPSEFAKTSVEKAVKKMIALKWDNPKEIIGDATAEQMLINLGLLSKKLGNVSKERLAVAFDRAGLLD